MISLLLNIAISFATSLLAVLVALWVELKRQPDIEITVGEDVNSDNTYPNNHPHQNERWKFFRVKVTNKIFPTPFAWIPRYTAQNCSAKIIFSRVGSEEKQNITMSGRWASTPEPAYLPQDQFFLKVLFPDPVSIPPGSSEILDILTQNENDYCGYGWNNEAYLHNWRCPAYRLDRGLYNVMVIVITQNGVKTFTTLKCQIGNQIEDTSLVEGLVTV